MQAIPYHTRMQRGGQWVNLSGDPQNDPQDYPLPDTGLLGGSQDTGGNGVAGQTIVDDDPSSPTYGQLVVLDSNVTTQNYSASQQNTDLSNLTGGGVLGTIATGITKLFGTNTNAANSAAAAAAAQKAQTTKTLMTIGGILVVVIIIVVIIKSSTGGK